MSTEFLDILSDLGQLDEYTIIRNTAKATLVFGEQVPGATTTFKISASVQPLNADELLEDFGGGERSRDTVKLYTDTELRTVDTDTGLKADIIQLKNDFYEIQRVECWNTHAQGCLAHFKCYASRMNKDEVKQT